MFNQILTAFQGFFSRSFWFGSFLPIAMVAVLHLAILEVAMPDVVPVGEWLDANAGEKATIFTIVVAALVVAAYALTPLIPLLRGILDGQLLPDWLHDGLRAARKRRWLAGVENVETAGADWAAFKDLRDRVPELWVAVEAGNALHDVTDAPAIDTAAKAIGELRDEMPFTRLPQVATAEAAFDATKAALEKNASTLDAGNPNVEPANNLAQARDLLISLLTAATVEAAYRRERAESYYRIDLRPTRVADARQLTERYSQDAYGVDFDYIWTRIQVVLPKEDNGFPQRLDDAQSQVNFSVLALVLAVSIPFFWLPFLLATQSTPWLFLTIGVLSPVALWLLYELVVQSQSAFGEIVRSAIDKYRLQVLTEIMNQPLPTTLAGERMLWRGLEAASQPESQFVVGFQHKKQS